MDFATQRRPFDGPFRFHPRRFLQVSAAGCRICRDWVMEGPTSSRTICIELLAGMHSSAALFRLMLVCLFIHCFCLIYVPMQQSEWRLYKRNDRPRSTRFSKPLSPDRPSSPSRSRRASSNLPVESAGSKMCLRKGRVQGQTPSMAGATGRPEERRRR